MFLTNFFVEKIYRLYPKVKKSLDNFEISYSFREVFLKSVALVLIDFSKTEIYQAKEDYIWKIANNQDTISITHSIFKAVKPLINDRKVLKNMNINDDIKTIILIALGVVGIGLIFFLLNQPSSSSDKINLEPKIKLESSKLQYLILVISAAKADILNSLSRNYSPDYDLCDKLYQSTKFIWFGSKQQSLSLFDDIFSERGVSYGNESEYDVYFVKIEIKDYNEDGFNSGVSSIKRIDAFRKLADLGKILDISERSPASAYKNRDLYNR